MKSILHQVYLFGRRAMFLKDKTDLMNSVKIAKYNEI